jgi:hypothetical protein
MRLVGAGARGQVYLRKDLTMTLKLPNGGSCGKARIRISPDDGPVGRRFQLWCKDKEKGSGGSKQFEWHDISYVFCGVAEAVRQAKRTLQMRGITNQ